MRMRATQLSMTEKQLPGQSGSCEKAGVWGISTDTAYTVMVIEHLGVYPDFMSLCHHPSASMETDKEVKGIKHSEFRSSRCASPWALSSSAAHS